MQMLIMILDELFQYTVMLQLLELLGIIMEPFLDQHIYFDGMDLPGLRNKKY